MSEQWQNGWTCPECGRTSWVLESPWPLGGEWEKKMPPNYCPHCGHETKGNHEG